MSVDLVRIVDSIHRDKNISKDILFEGIESALATAAKKHYPDADEIQVTIDRDSGEIEATKDGARIDPAELGRIAAQTAKQVMIQKIREAECDSRLRRVRRPEGRPGHRHRPALRGRRRHRHPRQDRRASCPAASRSPARRHHVGERIKAVILDVRKVGQRVKIILAATHPDFVRRLFENEIPEIADQHHRDPGPGPRGRLPLQGRRHLASTSKVDCRRRLRRRPRQPHQEHRRRAGRRADRHRPLERVAPGPDPQRPAAGRDRGGLPLPAAGPGHRAGAARTSCRWPSAGAARTSGWRRKLVGWDIEIMTHEELDELIEKAVDAFTKIDGVDTDLAEKLVEQGILSYDDLSVMEIADLVNTIEGLTEEQAIEIVARAETLAEEQADELPRRKGARPAAAPPSRRRRRAADEAGDASGPVARPDRPWTTSSASEDADSPTAMPTATRPVRPSRRRRRPRTTTSTVAEDGPSRRSTRRADEIRDLALAAEESGLDDDGHEVTSPPSDADQGETDPDRDRGGRGRRLAAGDRGRTRRGAEPNARPPTPRRNLSRPTRPRNEIRTCTNHEARRWACRPRSDRVDRCRAALLSRPRHRLPGRATAWRLRKLALGTTGRRSSQYRSIGPVRPSGPEPAPGGVAVVHACP